MFADDPRIDAFWNQIRTLFIFFERPVVQWQLWAFAAVVIAAWLFSFLLSYVSRRWRSRLQRPERSIGQYLLWRMLRAASHIYFPLLGILFSRLVMGYFAAHGLRYGVIERLLPIFRLLLAYRIVVAALYALFKEKTAETYQRHFVAPLFIIFVVLALNDNFASAFSLNKLPLFAVQDVQVTFGALMRALIIVYLFFIVAWLIKELLGKVAFPRMGADVGVTNTVVTTSYYVIISIGILTATSIIGFDWRTLAIIGGGLSVGIGFGMQDLVNNFISGILLLFERTLRPGDIVEVGGQRGVVEQLRMRSTILRTMDNIEIIVPNQNFLTSNVSTYTQSDRIVRRVIEVGVGYSCDPGKVRDILLTIADRHGLVLDEPEPVVFFSDFGASSLNFQLIIFVEVTDSFKVPSDLRFMIWSEFRRNNIEIPFPQRDLHVRSGIPWDALVDSARDPNNQAPREDDSPAGKSGDAESPNGQEIHKRAEPAQDGERMVAKLP